MTEPEVVALMESSNTAAEWNANISNVKKACGGYPDFWFTAIVQSGVADRTAAKWGGTAQIKITTFPTSAS